MSRLHRLGLAALVGTLAATAPSFAQPRNVVFAFDQNQDQILRMEDLNNDGDTLDPGEVTLFFAGSVPNTGVSNAQGMQALGLHELLATDNFPPDNIIRMRDRNLDGDAFDSGESSIWFNGALPGGFNLTNPVTLSVGPNADFYTLDNNTLDTANPEAIYGLTDLNNDGDVSDPGEATLFFELSPAGVSATTTFDVEFDNSGAAYVLDITDPNQIESVDRIDPTGTLKSEYFDSVDLLVLRGVVISGMFELAHDPARDEIILGTVDGANNVILLGVRDTNANRRIDLASEIRTRWIEGANADGVTCSSARDIFFNPADGSITFCDSGADQIVRLVDLNNDGDYNDLGESKVMYSSAAAGAAGLPIAEGLLSVTAYVGCTADFDGDGTVGLADLGILLGCWQQPCGDLDGNLTTDLADLGILLGDWGCSPN